MSRKILIVTKDAESLGGVANYYRLFFSKYINDEIQVESFDIGSRARDNYHRTRRPVGYVLDYLRDMWRLFWLLKNRPDIKAVQISPSLLPLPLIRDAGVLLLSKFFKRKVIVFFRGWRDDMAIKIADSKLHNVLFKFTYLRADHFIVLAECFVPFVEKWGVQRNHISVSRTMYDGDLVSAKQNRSGNLPRFVYLSRIAVGKGILDLINAAVVLHRKGYRFTIDIYGFGDVQENMPNARDRFDAMVSELGLQNICFAHEFIKDGSKYSVLAEGDVFVLPTYQEGCPNAVIEALASGLFVISTPVGAIPELVSDGEQGLLHPPGDVDALAEKMAWSIERIEDLRLRSSAISEYAHKHFESKAHIDQMVNLYRGVLDQKTRL
jgi:glycosyltransferase involved in cell wall biosynthesis